MQLLYWIIGLLSVGGLLLILLSLVLLFGYILAYVVTALGLYQIADKRHLPYPWMAWIPVVNLYLLGLMLHNELRVTPKLKITIFQYILPASFALAFLAGDNFIGSILELISCGLTVLAFIALFRQYKEPNAIVFGILAGLPVLNIVGCFLVYLLGSKPIPDASSDSTAFP